MDLIAGDGGAGEGAPPATKGPERLHGGPSRVCAICIKVIARGQELSIRIEHVGQRDRTGLVGFLRKVPRSGKGVHLSLDLNYVHLGL
jgi:hypothetical protein